MPQATMETETGVNGEAAATAKKGQPGRPVPAFVASRGKTSTDCWGICSSTAASRRRRKRRTRSGRSADSVTCTSDRKALAAGSIKAVRPDDPIITAYRDHTMAIAKGMSPRAAMAELYGRADGCSGGRGGSMHLFDASVGFYGGHGIVGGQIPLGAGLAWAIRYRGGDQVCVCYMGDAARQPGRVSGVSQHVGGLAAAGDLRRGEQRLRHGDGVFAGVDPPTWRPARVHMGSRPTP